MGKMCGLSGASCRRLYTTLILLLLCQRCSAEEEAADEEAAESVAEAEGGAAGADEYSYFLRFPALVSFQKIAGGQTSGVFPLKEYQKAKRLYSLLLQHAQQRQQQEKALKTHKLELVETLQEAEHPSLIPRFAIKDIPGYVLGGASALHFTCRLNSSSSSSISALMCSGKPPAGQRAVEASFGFQLPQAKASGGAAGAAGAAAGATGAAGGAAGAAGAAEQLVCKIGLQGILGGRVVWFLKGALGLCAAFGFGHEVYVHQHAPFFEALPGINSTSITYLGFSVVPSRYLPYPSSASLAAVNPNRFTANSQQQQKQAPKAVSVSDLMPMGALSGLSWRGIRVDPGPYNEAMSIVNVGLEKAVLTEGISRATEHNCSLEVGFKPQEFAAFQHAGASACKPGATLLACKRQLQLLPWTSERQRLSDLLLLQLEPLIPLVQGQGERMLHLLLRPGPWLLLQRLLGGLGAARLETPQQQKWYEEEMQHVSSKDYKRYPFNFMGGNKNEDRRGEALRSEALRFGTFFLDLLPSKAYWESLRLGCLPEAMGFASALGSVFERHAPDEPLSLEAAAAVAAGSNSSSERDSAHESGKEKQREVVSLLESEEIAEPQWKDPISSYAVQHEAAAAAAAQQLTSGLLLKPIQPVYAYGDLKNLADASAIDPSFGVTEEKAAAARKLWLESPPFSGSLFTVKGVPARKGGHFDLDIRCTTSGVFPITKRLVGWFSDNLCEPVYEPQTNTSSSSGGGSGSSSRPKPKHRLIGMEFEVKHPHRCGVSYLGNEEEKEETEVRGQVLLDLFLGLCWLHGFRAGWILDSVTDIYTGEKMRYTMGVERGESFYEHKGFLFSIDTIKQRSRPEPCLGFIDNNNSSSSSSTNGSEFVSGLCQVHQDLLQTPGFDPTVLYPFHEKAFNVLQHLVFDCHAQVWQGCSTSNNSDDAPFPLLEQREDGSCAFERHPLWLALAAAAPEHCGLGKRVGECHAFVRKQWGCTATRKRGCKYLEFIYHSFIYPGENPAEKIPLLVSQRWDRVGKEVAMHYNFHPRHLLIQLLHQELADCSRSTEQEKGGLREQLKAVGMTCEQLQKDGEILLELLQHSILLIDMTGLPQFWVSAENQSDIKEGNKTKPEKYCPAAFAWEFITRMQGQLYRHRRFALPLPTHAAQVHHHHNPLQPADGT